MWFIYQTVLRVFDEKIVLYLGSAGMFGGLLFKDEDGNIYQSMHDVDRYATFYDENGDIANFSRNSLARGGGFFGNGDNKEWEIVLKDFSPDLSMRKFVGKSIEQYKKENKERDRGMGGKPRVVWLRKANDISFPKGTMTEMFEYKGKETCNAWILIAHEQVHDKKKKKGKLGGDGEYGGENPTKEQIDEIDRYYNELRSAKI